jgi:ATP-binding cassette, subfamily B, bacterial
VTIGGFAGYLFTVNPLLAASALAAGVPRLVLQLRLNRRRAGQQLAMAGAARRHASLQSLLVDQQAVKEIRLFGLGDFFRVRVRAEAASVDATERRVDRAVLLTQAPLTVLSALIGSLGLLWAVTAAADGRISIGDITVFAAALTGIQGGLTGIVSAVGAVCQGSITLGHYWDIVAVRDDLPTVEALRDSESHDTGSHDTGSRDTGPAWWEGPIELCDVWFRYGEEGAWVLRGVDLTLRPGEATALVGVNGAGKSTLVKLLCRFYDPTRGAIRWGGVDLRELPPDQLRAHVGTVFQDFMRYELTAADNIGIGDLAHREDRAAVERSAAWAGMADTLHALPAGFDTALSRLYRPGAGLPQGTANLSGGQWQRVALARGFMRTRAGLLILDEPSSGLDAEAEHEVHEQLRELRQGRTSLLISHRLNTVRSADHIVVLDDGRIIERGTHDSLIAAVGEYARLFALQADGYHDHPASSAR